MSEWTTYTISEVCRRFSSGKGITASQIFEIGAYPVFGGNGIRGYTDTYNFEGECAIIGRQGAYCGNTKYFCGKAYMTEHAIVATANDEHNIGYIANLLSIMDLGQYQGQSAQPGLSVNTLSKIELKLPDKETQDSIFSLLFSLDKKITLNKQINARLEEMAKTLYDYWFVQFDFPDANGKPYRSSGGEMVFDETLKREIPKGLESVELQSCLAKVPNTVKILNKDIKAFGKYPVIDQSQDFICGFTDDEKSILNPQDAHIIFGDHTRIVKLVNFKYARGADGTQVILSNNERMPNYLFYQIINQIDLSSYGYARHFKFLKEFPIILPDKDISRKYNEIVNYFFIKIRNNIKQNHQLTQLRDFLLPMLMNGQVSVAE